MDCAPIYGWPINNEKACKLQGLKKLTGPVKHTTIHLLKNINKNKQKVESKTL